MSFVRAQNYLFVSVEVKDSSLIAVKMLEAGKDNNTNRQIDGQLRGRDSIAPGFAKLSNDAFI